jgi:hypothetical protein
LLILLIENYDILENFEQVESPLEEKGAGALKEQIEDMMHEDLR